MAFARTRPLPYMTVADFIDWDGGGHQGKLELVDGVVRAMSPASATHGIIQANLSFLISGHLKAAGARCRVVVEPAVLPRLHGEDNMRVPDLGVTCRPVDAGEIFVPDPLLLIEVLSPGNSNDTRESVRAYGTMPSVIEILVVHSTRIKAEVMARSPEGAWPVSAEFVLKGQTLRLASIEASFPIEDVYAGTHLV